MEQSRQVNTIVLLKLPNRFLTVAVSRSSKKQMIFMPNVFAKQVKSLRSTTDLSDSSFSTFKRLLLELNPKARAQLTAIEPQEAVGEPR